MRRGAERLDGVGAAEDADDPAGPRIVRRLKVERRVADDDGVVVIPIQRVVDVATEARAVAERTTVSRRWLERGGPIEALAGLDAAGIEALLRERGYG